MVAVLPGLSLKDREGWDVRSTLPTRRLHSMSNNLDVARLVTCITIQTLYTHCGRRLRNHSCTRRLEGMGNERWEVGGRVNQLTLDESQAGCFIRVVVSCLQETIIFKQTIREVNDLVASAKNNNSRRVASQSKRISKEKKKLLTKTYSRPGAARSAEL